MPDYVTPDVRLSMWPIKVGMRVIANSDAAKRGLIGHPASAVFTVKELPSSHPGWFDDENGDRHYISFYVPEKHAPIAMPDALRDFGPNPAPTVAEIRQAAMLSERKATHGDFTDHARCSQGLKRVLQDELARRNIRGQADLPNVALEAIDMILHKIARAVAGDGTFKEHWVDIAGYARITEERL